MKADPCRRVIFVDSDVLRFEVTSDLGPFADLAARRCCRDGFEVYRLDIHRVRVDDRDRAVWIIKRCIEIFVAHQLPFVGDQNTFAVMGKLDHIRQDADFSLINVGTVRVEEHHSSMGLLLVDTAVDVDAHHLCNNIITLDTKVVVIDKKEVTIA